MSTDLTDAEVNELIRASFEPKIPARVMPKPGPAAQHNFRAGVAYGLAAGRARAIEECAKVCEATALQIGDQYYMTGSKACAAAIRALNAAREKP